MNSEQTKEMNSEQTTEEVGRWELALGYHRLEPVLTPYRPDFLVIHIPPHPADQGLVEAARGTQDGPGDLARRALPSVIGGLVPLCFNLLLDDNILKAGGSPGYIKAAAYAGLGLVTVFTFLGLASKKRAKAAARVVASTSTAAVSIAVVYQVSDNAYIKCFCGIMGCVATLATMAINW